MPQSWLPRMIIRADEIVNDLVVGAVQATD